MKGRLVEQLTAQAEQTVPAGWSQARSGSWGSGPWTLAWSLGSPGHELHHLSHSIESLGSPTAWLRSSLQGEAKALLEKTRQSLFFYNTISQCVHYQVVKLSEINVNNIANLKFIIKWQHMQSNGDNALTRLILRGRGKKHRFHMRQSTVCTNPHWKDIIFHSHVELFQLLELM